MNFPRKLKRVAPNVRVASWKAMPLFAIAGGLLGGAQLLLGTFQSPSALILLFASGLIPWALAGGLYAYFAKQSTRDLFAPSTWLLLGAKAGAVVYAGSSVVASLVVLPMVAAKSQSTPDTVILAAKALSFMLCAGALQGALTGLIVGQFVLEEASERPVNS